MLTVHGKPEWLSRKQAANYLSALGCPITAKTLANMAANNNKGGGPSYMRFRWGSVRYLKSDLDAWRQREVVRVE